jgi:Uma2 family endonuclease
MKLATASEPRYTPQQYLAMERRAETKSEYVNGRIYAMSGSSREHNRISLNLAGYLNAHNETGPCETYAIDIRVKAGESGGYFYPDVVVACGEPRFEDDAVDTLINPSVIVEVLSQSTEAFDRGGKFAHYSTIESLQDYVLVSQSSMRVEHYARHNSSQWLLTVLTEPAEELDLSSAGCRIPLHAIYARVSFPSPEVDSSTNTP